MNRLCAPNFFDAPTSLPHGERFDTLLTHRNLVIERIVSTVGVDLRINRKGVIRPGLIICCCVSGA